MKHLNAKIPIVSHVVTRHASPQFSHVHGSLCVTTEECLLFLIDLLADLGHCDFVKIWTLKKCIYAVKTAHHITPLLFEIDVLSVHLTNYKFPTFWAWEDYTI